MHKFQIAGPVSGYTKEELRFAMPIYQAVADGIVDDFSMGICWNTATAARNLWKDAPDVEWFCFYNLTSKLFQAIRGVEDSYPLRIRPWADDFACRYDWCAVFAKGLQTGTLEVSDELLETLKSVDSDE